MSRQSAVKCDRRNGRAPERQKPNPAAFHGIQRNQTQGVIQEMSDQVKQQDQTATEPYPSDGHRENNLLRAAAQSLSWSSWIDFTSSRALISDERRSDCKKTGKGMSELTDFKRAPTSFLPRAARLCRNAKPP